MFNKNKRAKKFSDLLIPGIILIIIGIVFAFQGIRDYSKLNGDLLNLNTASEKDLDADKYVEIDVDYAFYSFCENVETTNYVFKRTTDQYYLISALKDNEYYIGLNIAESKKSELEALSDYTWSQSGAEIISTICMNLPMISLLPPQKKLHWILICFHTILRS